MKRLWKLVLIAALALSLASCQRAPASPDSGSSAPAEEETDAFALSLAQELVETPGAFSETLEPVDAEVALSLYGLEEQEGLEIASYHSTGATAEEATVVRFPDEEGAKAFVPQAQLYLADQLEANGGYRPLEVPKLENALLERRGSSVLLLVAADYQAAQALLEG